MQEFIQSVALKFLLYLLLIDVYIRLQVDLIKNIICINFHSCYFLSLTFSYIPFFTSNYGYHCHCYHRYLSSNLIINSVNYSFDCKNLIFANNSSRIEVFLSVSVLLISAHFLFLTSYVLIKL